MKLLTVDEFILKINGLKRLLDNPEKVDHVITQTRNLLQSLSERGQAPQGLENHSGLKRPLVIFPGELGTPVSQPGEQPQLKPFPVGYLPLIDTTKASLDTLEAIEDISTKTNATQALLTILISRMSDVYANA